MSPAEGLSRRTALKLFSAQVALLASGCGRPAEEIVPYVHMPERLVPGIPLAFASTLPLGGYGRGVICTSVEGRPIKVSGNPRHPASLGATDVFAEASVFALYDPDRSQAIRRGGEIADRQGLEGALAGRFGAWAASGGHGLVLLTGPLTSPTALAQIDALKRRYPGLRWLVHDPLADRAAGQGAEAAFGTAAAFLPRWPDVERLVTFDADPLGPGPAQIRNAQGFGARRRVRRDDRAMLRLYAVEAAPTLTGANADHKILCAPGARTALLAALARGLGADLPAFDLPPDLAAAAAAMARDLDDHKGHALVLAGPSLAPELHAVVHWINATLAAPQDALAPVAPPGDGTLAELMAALKAGAVDTLVMAGCNPAYDAPESQAFAALVAKVPLSLHLGLAFDETAALAQWHLPEAHPLESWSDLRAVDGTPSLVQPLLRPLHESFSLHRLLAALGGDFAAEDYGLVRAFWQGRADAQDFEAWWRGALEAGVIAEPPPPALALGPPRLPQLAAPQPSGSSFQLILRPDPCLWDGAPANNPWLQECPKPLTKEVWGNGLGLGAEDAARLGLATGDLAQVSTQQGAVLVPALIEAGHAPGTLSLTLGFGRSRAGTIGNGIGVDAYALRDASMPFILGVDAVKASGTRPITSTQEQFRLDGDAAALYPTFDLDHFPAAAAAPQDPVPTLLPRHDYTAADARWAMVIDAGACIGCNACVVACQAENNGPVIGPEEIARHRDMHWLRIDRYDIGTGTTAASGFQPVPCMHCETAPCEPVCPVGASVHDSEGLNVQVYNRCIGTRFCEANCPYKVRRFNFFGYANDQPYGDLGEAVMRAHYNPNVTVRARGVMEKCTYCVQRISGARRAAEKQGRPLGPDDVVTACQSACPTRAIAFGNLNAAGSAVAALREEPHHYALLGHLDTKPRTTYLAKIRDPNAGFDKEAG